MISLTNEQIIAAIDSAPILVQEALRGGETAKIIAGIGVAHHLHIDQIGSLAQINRNLLIGLVAPAEMYGELIEIGVSADEARQIMAEINEKIFVPLRERVRNDSPEATAPTPKPQAAAVAPPQPSTAPVPFISPTPERVPTAPLTPTPSMTQTPHTQVFASTGGWPGAPAGNWQPAAAVHVYVPGPAPVHATIPPAPVAPQPLPNPEPLLPTIVEIAHPDPHPIPVSPAPRPTPLPPANLPGAPTDEPSVQPIEKSYVADPYREPPV